MEVDEFEAFGDVVATQYGTIVTSIKPDNKILAVAHRDYVADNSKFNVARAKKDTYIFNGALDDRLGIYTILKTLPDMGLNFDYILTDGEESGMSTAGDFETDKKYNWIFSFDRRGNGVVMYQYDNKESREAVTRFGFKVDFGSFSDISFLDGLGCLGFNFGVGYFNEHTARHYMSVKTWSKQVNKFVSFFNHYKDVPMPYVPAPRPVYKRYGNLYGSATFDRDGFNYDGYAEFGYANPLYEKSDNGDWCDLCGRYVPKTYQTIEFGEIHICESCINSAGQCVACGNVVRDWELVDGVCDLCRRPFYN